MTALAIAGALGHCLAGQPAARPRTSGFDPCAEAASACRRRKRRLPHRARPQSPSKAAGAETAQGCRRQARSASKANPATATASTAGTIPSPRASGRRRSPSRPRRRPPPPISPPSRRRSRRARKGERRGHASAETISDPVARKLVEWAILRSDDNEVDYSRYVAFITENPSWPSIGLLRRRAEAALWQDQPDPATVRAFSAGTQPTTAKGKFALARALLLQGDRAGAQGLVREAWRNDELLRRARSARCSTYSAT